MRLYSKFAAAASSTCAITIEARHAASDLAKDFCRVLQWILTSYDDTPDHTLLKGLVMPTIQHFQFRAIANAGAHKFACYEIAGRLSEKHKGQKLVVPCTDGWVAAHGTPCTGKLRSGQSRSVFQIEGEHRGIQQICASSTNPRWFESVWPELLFKNTLM